MRSSLETNVHLLSMLSRSVVGEQSPALAVLVRAAEMRTKARVSEEERIFIVKEGRRCVTEKTNGRVVL